MKRTKTDTGERTSKASTPAPAEGLTPQNRTVTGQFRKGFSGNPGGRPKSKPFKEALEAVLRAAGPTDDLAAIARALRGQAVAGNVAGMRELADRLDGKVPQAVAGIERKCCGEEGLLGRVAGVCTRHVGAAPRLQLAPGRTPLRRDGAPAAATRHLGQATNFKH